jgi:MOSC domain-containing protein YiiM
VTGPHRGQNRDFGPQGRIEAVCVSGTDLPSVPGRKPVRTGIDKQPVAGRVAVRELGLDGDVQVNRRYHGGEGQAVYAYAQEDAEHWIAELGRELPPGRFGENLRTTGLDLRNAVLGERWRVGTALLEVTAWRIPCANFARFWDVPDLVKRFSAHGATGAYLRVLETGDIGAGDIVDVVFRPDHGITVERGFRITTTEKPTLPELAPALAFLPHKDQPKLAAKIEARTAGTG